MTRALVVWAFPAAFFLACAGAASLHDAVETSYAPAAIGPTIVVGDSITFDGAPYLSAARPSWHIDGVPGRKAASLPSALKADLAQWGTPKNLVIALGQNESPGWSAADYVEAVEMVPASTHVFLVTTYRDPAVFGQDRADTQAMYSRWMRRIAANRANVWVVDWRKACLSGAVTLEDGSHPDEASRAEWARMVDGAVTSSWSARTGQEL